ncbi:MAG: Holliday junction branch migration protein RuvA, partial [Cellvibrionaceae bacterium]|nr:Holliday junction branch migration protein RuvA [Cellvibrionaceae bacterium]
GVGYELQVPMSSIYRLGNVGEAVQLHTHMAVSETSQQLFGFAERRDRELFRTLIKINGVGPKMALAILSGMEAEDLVRCVMDDNVGALVKVPGVGKKTAERLIIELRDKLKDWQPGSAPLAELEAASAAKPAPMASEEAESALIALGYKPTEASKMVAAVLKAEAENIHSSEDLIRLSLKSMMP